MKKIPLRKISTNPDDSIPVVQFKIRDVADLLGGKDLVHELHRHDFFFVLALRNGTGTHEIDFTIYPVKDHAIFILRPGQVHRLELKTGATGFLMEFDPSFYRPNDNVASQRLSRASHKNFCTVEDSRYEKLFAELAGILDEYHTKQEGYADVIKARLDIFFIEFIRQSQGAPGTKKNNTSYAQERFDEFLELLNNPVTNLKRVSQYADLLNLSIYQLNSVTRAAVGKSASDLINEQIILEAKRHLLATTNQVKDISFHLGYEDFSYFIRFFKKHTGYSPDAFRKHFQ